MLVEPKNSNDEQQLARAVLHLNGTVTGLALGALCGAALFIATLLLVLKGGEHVGAHLKLLSQYFIGYTVTVAGSFVGLFYGFVTGFIAGWLIAWIYNRIIALKGR